MQGLNTDQLIFGVPPPLAMIDPVDQGVPAQRLPAGGLAQLHSGDHHRADL
jgi:hypothetical protein